MKKQYILYAIFFLLYVASCNQSQPEEQKTQQSEKTDSIQEIKHPQIDLINESIAQDSTNAELYFSRGVAHQKLMNFQSAASDFEQAIQLNDTVSAYYLNLAALFVEGNNVVPAINVLTKGLEKQPDNINMLLALSKYYLYIDDTNKSIKMANEVLKINATNADAYFNKGLAYIFSSDTMKAISSLQTATEQNPDYYDAYIQLGLLCAAKQLAFAEGYYQNAIRLQPESVEARYGLGIYYQNIENYAAAKNTYRSIIGFDTQFKDAYYNLGYIYFQQDSLKKALRHFDMAAKVDVGFTRAYYMRGLTYEAIGDTANAKKDYNQTLSLDVGFEKAKDGLKRINY